MKLLVMLIFFAFQTFVNSTVYAWSPLDEFRSTVKAMQHCYLTAASIEVSQEGEGSEKEEEGEEEPDCE